MKTRSILPVLIAALLLSACDISLGGGTPAAPTLSPLELQATAQSLAQVSVQQTMMAMPTQTPWPTPTLPPLPTATQPPLAIPTLSVPGAGGGTGSDGTSNQSCDSFSFNPSTVDITVPDGTKMVPGDLFTKTWRIYNAGSCTWDTGYHLVFVLGDQMGGPDSVALTGTVKPGNEIDISVPLEVNVTKTGITLVGNWRMQNDEGEFFGTFLTVTVRVVSTDPTETPTEEPTATATP